MMTEEKRGKTRVFLGENNRTIRAILAKILEESGLYTIVGAAERTEHVTGFVMGLREPPEILILDPHMPTMPFEQVIECVRALDNPPHVVVLVERGRAPLATEVCRRGASHYITKPLDGPWVLDTLARLVAGEYQPGHTQQMLGQS